jgi:proline iminopeptidase
MHITTPDGLRLYAGLHGAGSPLLYLHGGPGAGSIDFAEYQADRLGGRFQLICLDQRGVHRSDRLAGRSCTLDDLVADCETVRQALGLERWSILAHAFGAQVALRYAARYPERVQALVLEAPIIDLVASARTLAAAAAELYDLVGDAAGAATARGAAAAPGTSSRAIIEACIAATDNLGEQRGSLYFQAVLPSTYDELLDEHLNTDELTRTQEHFAALLAHPDTFTTADSLLPRVQAPTLLVRGRFDPLCTREMLERCQAGLPKAEPLIFSAAAHFPHVEEANRFATLVGDWLARHVTAQV